MQTLEQISSYLKDRAGLQRLVTDRISESQHLDYKSSTYGRGAGDKRELRRDATAIANGGGGYIVVGVDEQDDVASSVPGIPNPTTEETSIRDTLTSCIEPPFRPGGFSIATRTGAGAQGVIVIAIPGALPSQPHSVAESSRALEFWMRRDKKKSCATYAELRAAFLTDASLDPVRRSLERIDKAWHAVRIQPMPEANRHDIFRLRDIGEHEITLEKDSSAVQMKISLSAIQSVAPSGGPSEWSLTLEPPNRLVWDHPRWKVSTA